LQNVICENHPRRHGQGLGDDVPPMRRRPWQRGSRTLNKPLGRTCRMSGKFTRMPIRSKSRVAGRSLCSIFAAITID
jgi:hypothetical protein